MSDALAAGLVRLGCGQVWALGASKVAGFLDAARRNPSLAVRGAPDEATAVMAADGATRATGVPAVAAFIGSVGLGTAAVGIQTVVGEGSPVLLVIGQSDPDTPPGGLQDTLPAGSNDIAVLTEMGARCWNITEPSDLLRAWPAVTARLAAGQPAVLLLAESTQWRPWPHGPLLAEPRSTPELDAKLPAVIDLSSRLPDPPVGMTRHSLWLALAAAVPGAKVFADAGQSRHVGVRLLQRGLPLIVHHCPRTASLGWGLRAALGAAAAPGARTYAICGDGGLMMSLGALAATAQWDLPVTVILACNGILGVDSARGPQPPADLQIPGIDWVAMGVSMGVEACHAASAADVQRLIRREGPGPMLIVTDVPAFEDHLAGPGPATAQPVEVG
jgi:thiamine pyrophosphate-dependent acetolactate synthase large subunit-like protein